MGNRTIRLVTIGAFFLAMARLENVLLDTLVGIRWEIVITLMAALGLSITAAGLSFRWPVRTLVAVQVVVWAILGLAYLAPGTFNVVLPTSETWRITGDQVVTALRSFRFGAPPVTPLAGLVFGAGTMIWALVSTSLWAAFNDRPILTMVPPMAFYLQLSTIDRTPSTRTWVFAFVLLATAGLVGLTARNERWPSWRKGRAWRRLGPAAVLVLIVFAGSALLTPLVPAGGTVPWRTGSGLGGDFYGSIAYNPFVDVRTQLNSQSDAVVFSVRLEGDVNPRNVYYRLLTLDNFNGRWWGATAPELQPSTETQWEAEGQSFRGDRTRVRQTITIDALANSWLPAAYAPVELASNARLVYETARVAPDGSLHIDANAYRGLTYAVTSEIPQIDLVSLSAGQRGTSPLFAAAGQDGVFAGSAEPRPAPELSDEMAVFLELPDELPSAVAALARNETLGLETAFEKGIALETFFRRTGGFNYSLDVAPAAPGTPTEDWLLDPASEHYRSGYCEQFSGWMAVMARALGIPSRVVLGFTPGVQVSNDTVVVRDRNAHAWVELWIDGMGWIPFDPTPRSDTPSTTGTLPFDATSYLEEIEAAERARLAEAAGSVPLFPGENQFDITSPLAGGGDADGGQRLPGWLPEVIGVAAVAAVVLGVIPGLKALRRRRRLNSLKTGDISGAWADLVDRLRDADQGPHPTDTPEEMASRRPSMRPLAAAYSRQTYGPPGAPARGVLSEAVRSYQSVTQELREQPMPKRLAALYRLRSLMRRR